MQTATARKVLTAAAVVMMAGTGRAAPPAFVLDSVARSGQNVVGVGPISQSVAFGAGQGPGFLKVSINDTGAWLLHAHVVDTDPLYDDVALTSGLGLTPLIAENVGGFLGAPSASAVSRGFWSMSLNNAGTSAIGMAWATGEGSMTNLSAAYFGVGAQAVAEGAIISAAGLAAGTTLAAFDANTRVQLNNANQLLVLSRIVETAVTKRAVLVFQLNGSGSVTGTTLVAKEGGPVGAGPATWTTIAGGNHAAAMNATGRVVFSGTTSSGVNGVYVSDVGFAAVQGGATPVGGQTWGALAGAPVDINASGTVTFRGVLANGSGIFTEAMPEAGEEMDTAARTFGNGVLDRIDGTLSDDLDVDMFRIIVTNPATFSATTVPDAGSGFAGATWDTVLTLVASPENGTRGLLQCDNVSAGVVQSTLSGGLTVAGREYYVCVSTSRSRAAARVWNYSTDTFPNWEIWYGDPAGVAVGGGLVYFADPSAGTIRRSTAAGVLQTDLAAPAVTGHIAVDQAGGKVYWIDRGAGGPEKLRRSNLDGSGIEDLVTVNTFGSIAAYDATGIALDLVNGKVYWSRSIQGEINRCNLDGSSPQRVIQDYPPTDAAFPHALPLQNFAPNALAVDPVGGRMYYYNEFHDRIERALFNGTGREVLAVGAGAAAVAVDSASGRLYWTDPGAGKIWRSNLDGSGAVELVTTPEPQAMSLDIAGGFIYWANTAARLVRRAPIGGGAATDVVSAGLSIGEEQRNGPGADSTFFTWLKSGAASTGALPYQVKLTGATFRHENAMIVKGNAKVAAVGDVLPGTAPNSMTIVGGAASPLRISDRGDVAWLGAFYQPTPINNYLFGALFWNGERLLTSEEAPVSATTSGHKLVFFNGGPSSLDMSDNGRYLMVTANMSSAPFVQWDHALTLDVTLPPVCAADFNGSGAVTVQDIFDFLAAYFAGLPSADFNGSSAVTVQDIFDFLAAYFAGCS